MIVSSAAMEVRLNSIFSKANMPSVMITSCASAAMAPTENCHWKRNQI